MRQALFVFFVAAGTAFTAVPLLTFPASLPESTIRAAAVDNAGNVYVTGTTYTSSSGTNSFPASAGAFQTVFNHGVSCKDALYHRCLDAYVAKFSPAGKLVYATFLGGSDDEEGFALAVDPAGNAWVAGYTFSNDFPVTANALQPKNAGGSLLITPNSPPPFQGDAFLTEINAAGTALLYSSFLGGSGPDVANALALGAQGTVYLAGETRSSDFPITGPPRQTGTGFVARFDPAGPSLRYSTYVDVRVEALAVDLAGNAYITGTAYATGSPVTTTAGAFQTTLAGSSDAFVIKLSPDGATRLYATLLGGAQTEDASGIAVDTSGNAWVVGRTASADFPGTPPAASGNPRGFVAQINPDGSALVFAATLGGRFSSILLDATGNAYVSGTAGISPPTLTPDALERAACGLYQNLITKWSPHGDLVYASYSREGLPVAIDGAGNLYLVHYANESPSELVRLDLSADQRQSTPACMMNAASFTSLGVAPGEIVSLFGEGLGPDPPVPMQIDASGKVSTEIGNTRVLFDGVPVPLLYAGPNQINLIAPWGLMTGKNTIITVESGGVASLPLTAPVVAADPGIFKITPSLAPTQGAILNQDGSVNSVDNPAAPGSIISIFGTGMGLLSPIPQDGEFVPDAAHLLQSLVEVTFSGPTTGQVLYAGAAPTLVAGTIQVNVRLPDTFPDFVYSLPGGVGIFIRVGNGNESSGLASVAVAKK